MSKALELARELSRVFEMEPDDYDWRLMPDEMRSIIDALLVKAAVDEAKARNQNGITYNFLNWLNEGELDKCVERLRQSLKTEGGFDAQKWKDENL